ncbi:hypothetical protein SAMN04488693_10825 [Arthrobacter subterraneus]|uniref:Uncharacterized protein n=2 Tax=Arthrobacter subterraneus TaxID=335973 RepID=A0A1G8J3T4_9MICC|nr:hypothetical protein SAMN04488693_10825 [Arthrobacter subterraneus]
MMLSLPSLRGSPYPLLSRLAACKDWTLLRHGGHEPSTVGVRYTPNGIALGAAYAVLRDVLDVRVLMLTVPRDGRLAMQYFKHDNRATVTGMGLAGDTWHSVSVGMLGAAPSYGERCQTDHPYVERGAQSKFGKATAIGLRATLNGAKFGNFVTRRNLLLLPTLV